MREGKRSALESPVQVKLSIFQEVSRKGFYFVGEPSGVTWVLALFFLAGGKQQNSYKL